MRENGNRNVFSTISMADIKGDTRDGAGGGTTVLLGMVLEAVLGVVLVAVSSM